jgi:hypothetical protein
VIVSYVSRAPVINATAAAGRLVLAGGEDQTNQTVQQQQQPLQVPMTAGIFMAVLCCVVEFELYGIGFIG